MDLHLYNYAGENNVINKFATDIQLIKSLDVELRMPFNPLSPTFTISEYHKCNYCHFYYHDIFYACYCDITTLSDGLYQVNCYVDSLTTAYQNGAMLGVQCKMVYSAFGNAFIPDPRLTVNGKINRDTYQRVIGGAGAKTHLITVKDNYYDGNQVVPTTVGVYVIQTEANLMDFFGSQLNKMEAENPGIYSRVMSSILDYRLVEFIPANDDGKTIIESGTFEVTDKIPVKTLIDPINDVNKYELNYLSWFATNTFRYKNDTPFSIDYTINVNYTPSPYDPPIKIQLGGIGEFSLNMRDYDINSLNDVGVRIFFDFIGKQYIMYPVLNNTIDRRRPLIAPMSLIQPLMTITSANDDRNARLDSLNRLTSGITNAVSGGSAFLNGNIGGIMSAFNSNLALSIAEIKQQNSPPSSGTVVGNVGGNPLGASGVDMLVIIERAVFETNPDGFKSLFGAPDGEIRFIGDMQGYFVADDVHLNIVGLPVAIVNEAESQLKTGVYMV